MFSTNNLTRHARESMLQKHFSVALVFVAASMLGCESKSPTSDTPASTPIESIQDSIAAADFSEDAYYAKTYRFAEPKYWLRIAGWLAEDSIERQFVKNERATSVLDLGCGYGTLLAYATEIYAAKGTCFDVIPYLQDSVKRRYAIEFTKLDIERDPFPESLKFDVILMTEVIEHLNFHPKFTLEKIFNALNPGGSFFISTPDADKGWGRVFEYYESIESMPAPIVDQEWIDGHIWQYTEDEIRDVLHAAGFTIKRLAHAPGAVGQHFNIWAVKPQ